VPRESWDALLRPDDNPFLRWDFLEALESSGSAVPRRRWWPAHLTVWQGDALRAAAPAYVKHDCLGDFSRDWAFANALRQLGGALYPKLVLGVPFSPVQGRRLLTGGPSGANGDATGGCDDAELAAALLDLAREWAERERLAAVQVLYHHPGETVALRRAGFAPRALVQYHWHNHGYRCFEDWLAALPAKKRTQIRRERREPERQGLELRTLDGTAVRERPRELAALAYDLYRRNCEKHVWGAAYLTAPFFHELFERLPERIELVVAERSGEIVAGAINLATPSHLFGRYWGCREEHRFLHFNVCLYHGIEECIARGRSVFEGGAGGEHKLARGFRPVIVPTAHRFSEARIQRALLPALLDDWEEREREVAAFLAEHGAPTAPESFGTAERSGSRPTSRILG
jgi:predicted N-acyltransferase